MLFLINVAGFKATGIPVQGVYHFLYPLCDADVKLEAESCIANVTQAGLKPDDITIWADCEYDTVTSAMKKGVTVTAADQKRWTQLFCQYIQEAGYRTGIYANLDYIKNVYGVDFISLYDLWLAQYNSKAPQYECMYKQYTSSGSVPGINGNVDMNMYYPDVLSKSSQAVAKVVAKNVEYLTKDEKIQLVIDIAMAEVGYKEKASGNAAYLYDKTANAGSGNYTKYGLEMHKLLPSVMDYPAPWCDCFVDWYMYMAFGTPMAKVVLCGDFDDYTVYSANYYKKSDRWYVTSPKKGDQVFFGEKKQISHTGLVYQVTNAKLYTIEGNSGNMVKLHVYDLTDPYIIGYGRPDYEAVQVQKDTKLVSLAADTAKEVSSNKSALNTTPKWVGRVKVQSYLNVRTWAGISYRNIKSWPKLKNSDLVDICDTVKASDGIDWYYIQIAGKYYGFVHSGYIVQN